MRLLMYIEKMQKKKGHFLFKDYLLNNCKILFYYFYLYVCIPVKALYILF